MYLKSVTLRNFRCFEQFELDLHPQLTVLVGLNGTGKTALLDGIAAGLSPVLRYLSSANQRLSAAGAGIRDTDFKLVPFAKRAGRDRWGASDFAQVVIETSDGLRWDEWRASTKSKATARPDRVGHKQLVSRLSEISESFKSPSRELLPVFAYYGAQRGSIDVPQKLHKAKEHYDHLLWWTRSTHAAISARCLLGSSRKSLRSCDETRASTRKTGVFHLRCKVFAKRFVFC